MVAKKGRKGERERKERKGEEGRRGEGQRGEDGRGMGGRVGGGRQNWNVKYLCHLQSNLAKHHETQTPFFFFF